ncbi:hypothetical protein CfE428DRAFT_5588 [Chthoniobacter flavus Ellin428]|uniref:Uncharacterized protein n=1 Tax=Chthoniobacter flavus Ellin428 TaxID=497964 RepID=B4D9J8_9BACT|nr:hypothetical protein CfE428DRAFT_5588 [Chthoniobacter flavus Ellin428]TCO87836.1 hypothetical protein EV701_120135 [Chthoniobacter flavus]
MLSSMDEGLVCSKYEELDCRFPKNRSQCHVIDMTECDEVLMLDLSAGNRIVTHFETTGSNTANQRVSVG